MIIKRTIRTKTADGIQVKIDTEIIWINTAGRPPGVYTNASWSDGHGRRHVQRPRYFGIYGANTGLVVFQDLARIVLTIPKKIYQGHVDRCLHIFHSHSQSGDPANPNFKRCGTKNCAVCRQLTGN